MLAAGGGAVNIFLLAGVATTKSAFNVCRDKLDQLFRESGVEPRIHILHPYGDNSRSLLRQVLEVGSDLTSFIAAGRIGGQMAYRQVKEKLMSADEPSLFIGHSGGGAAAYQAAKMLMERNLMTNFRVLQVGSPRNHIAPQLKDKVCYLYSVNEAGKLNDPVSRIGSWGGWTRSTSGLPQWQQMKHAPGKVEPIHVIGGHAHYFRHQEAFRDQDAICNLDKTIDRLQLWLKDWH